MTKISDRDKERILQEEMFRHEVRQQIAATPQKTSRQTVWAFLNSPFGLWFLSTLVISVLTWSYSQWQANQTHKQESDHQRAQLYLEVPARAQALDALVTTTDKPWDLAHVLAILDNPKPSDNAPSFGIFPEYRERSLRSLLFQLRELVENEAERDRINAAIEAANQINLQFETGRVGDAVSPEQMQRLKSLLQKLNISAQ